MVFGFSISSQQLSEMDDSVNAGSLSSGTKRGRKPGRSSSNPNSKNSGSIDHSSTKGGDMKAKLERSRQSARECRARKKLRYQYLEELVTHRERSVLVLRRELDQYRQWCHDMDEGRLPEGIERLVEEVRRERDLQVRMNQLNAVGGGPLTPRPASGGSSAGGANHDADMAESPS